MTIWRKALLSITRQRIKTCVLFLIIYIIGMVLLSSIALQESMKYSINQIMNTVGSNVTIVEDMEKISKIKGDIPDYELITEEDIIKLGKLSSVDDFDYSTPTILSVKNFHRADISSEPDHEDYNHSNPEQDHIENIALVGFASSPMLEIKRNVIKIIEGSTEINTEEPVVIISKELAEANSLNVGENMDLSVIINSYEDASKPYIEKNINLKIVALYEIAQKNIGNINELNYKLNNIYVPNKQIKEIDRAIYKLELDNFPENYLEFMNNNQISNIDDMYQILTEDNSFRTIFTLKSGKELSTFLEDATPIMNRYPYLKILTTSDYYEKVSPQLKAMSKLSSYILIGGISLASAVLIMVLLLFFNDRKKEFGIYVSLGNSYKIILLQVMLEVIIVSVIAITLSIITGYLVRNNITPDVFNSIAPNDLSIHESDVYAFERIANTIVTDVDINNMFEFQLSLNVILKIYLYGIGLITFITGVSLLYLKKIDLKKILL